MRLNRVRAGAWVALLMASAAWAGLAHATFADAAGFSGRAGATCTSCHTAAPLPQAPAQAHLDGLPDSWDLGATYPLTVRVTGGPDALPAPQPQGGFDLAVGAGRLVLPPGSDGLLRLVGEHEATYLPAGTLMRQWRVDWIAPSLAAAPAPVPVWLAVVAANGNHVVATNTSDGGERFDASASLTASIPPSAAALAAWKALPLVPPQADAAPQASTDGWVVEGRHADPNATRLLWSLDGHPWQAKDTGAQWRLVLPAGPGEHVLRLRSEGADRLSPDATLAFGEPGVLEGMRAGRDVPAPAPLPSCALLLAIAAFLRFPRCPP